MTVRLVPLSTSLFSCLALPLIVAGSFQLKKNILHATLTEVETLNLPSSSSPIRGEIKSHKKFKCKIFFHRKFYNCVCLFLNVEMKKSMYIVRTYLQCGVLTLAGEAESYCTQFIILILHLLNRNAAL